MSSILHKLSCFISLNLCIVSFSLPSLAEGTKQFRPSSGDYGNLEINDQGRPFALESNTNPLNRLYFHIGTVGEKVYFGFQHLGSGGATFRIKNPSGTVVYNRTNVPSSGTGYIGSYAEAVAGPKIGGVPSNGYSPLSYTPTTTGDFYMEFTTDVGASNTYHFDLFDITVTTATNTPINGRVWSYAWDLSTRGGSNAYNGSFYVYTNEGYVSKVSMNGIQPWGFVVSCNNSGPGNTGNVVNDRKSVSGNSTRPQFKVFLNDPDNTEYPSASIPTLNQPITVDGGSIFYQTSATFNVDVSAPGTIQILFDINGVAGYQAGTTDVIIAQNVNAGYNAVVWNGQDGFGNYPDPETVINVSTGFSAGVTHLPIYDPETNPGGYIVNRIRPATDAAPIRWDDSNLGGITNISGGSGNGHQWGTNFGDLKTINTWWNGYEVENISAFTLRVKVKPLPIVLKSFKAELKGNNQVALKWETATEQNNKKFTIERSTDGVHFSTIAEIEGAGNSTIAKQYTKIDENPANGDNYYRLSQTDFDGARTFQAVEYVLVKLMNQMVTGIYPNPMIGNFINFFMEDSLSTTDVQIQDMNGQSVFNASLGPKINRLNFDNPLQPGRYLMIIATKRTRRIEQLVIL